jgi:aspartyl-tRNA(Asn)/glutamyl-tRNA(Gln) amidotransferase subunit B
VADRASADLFDAALSASAAPATLAKQFVNAWSKLAGDRGVTVASLGVDAQRMAQLSRMVDAGSVSAGSAGRIAEEMIGSPDAPDALAERMGLVMVTDENQTREWVDEVFAANAQAAQDAAANPKKAKAAAGFLRGQVMRVSGGKADPKLAGKLIEARLLADRDG